MEMNAGNQRSLIERAVDAVAVQRVERGIALLKEKHGANFADFIDCEKLDLSQGAACVIGQLYNSKPEGKLDMDDANSYVRGCVALGITVEGWEDDEEFDLLQQSASYYGFITAHLSIEEMRAAGFSEEEITEVATRIQLWWEDDLIEPPSITFSILQREWMSRVCPNYTDAEAVSNG